MNKLKPNELQFVEFMRRSAEHATHGFQLLSKRADPARFFDEIRSQGLLDPEENPAPVPVDSGGPVSIPYWGALDYLLACAKESEEQGSTDLAQKILAVVHAVSEYRDRDDEIRDNFHTFRVFADILGILPLASLGEAEIDLVPVWLKSRFDRNGVANALDQGLLARLLADEKPDCWPLAARLLGRLLEIRWSDSPSPPGDSTVPTTVVDSYWISRIIAHHAVALGGKCGFEASAVLRKAVADVFTVGAGARWSWIVRPAVEEHEQNRDSISVHSCVVVGLRDVLLNWVDVNPSRAGLFVKDLIVDDVQMLRRIGIFVLSARWRALKGRYVEVLGPALFDQGHVHELYNLFRSRFGEFTRRQKDRTLAIVRRLKPYPTEDEEGLQRRRALWLQAMAGFGDDRVEEWLGTLREAGYARFSDHPDFNSYSHFSWGGLDRSPYGPEQLIAFLEEGTFAERLHAFEPTGAWEAPTLDGLTRALAQATASAPNLILKQRPALLEIAPHFQRAVVDGLKRSWETSKSTVDQDPWAEMWAPLMALLLALVQRQPEHSDSPVPQVVEWQLAAIGDLLRSGTADDDHAYPESLLQQGWAVIVALLDRLDGVPEPDEDAMMQAINAPRGRVIEAMWSHLLRACRVADRSGDGHTSEWIAAQPIVDRELSACVGANFEFSTLAGAYLANLQYLSADWLVQNCRRIFPCDFPRNFRCALSGLAYGASSRSLYILLRDSGVIDLAVGVLGEGGQAAKSLVERMTLGFVWGEEELKEDRVQRMFSDASPENLRAAVWTLSRAKGEKLAPGQRERIVAFANEVIRWSLVRGEVLDDVVGILSTLVWALDANDRQSIDVLDVIAGSVEKIYGTHEFVGELRRFVDGFPREVAHVVDRMVGSRDQLLDYQGGVEALVEQLAEKGAMGEAVQLADRLRHLPGMQDVYKRLTALG